MDLEEEFEEEIEEIIEEIDEEAEEGAEDEDVEEQNVATESEALLKAPSSQKNNEMGASESF